MSNNDSQPFAVRAHFLQHQRIWSVGLLLLWASANTLLLASTEVMEVRRTGHTLPWWEPLCWEVTSIGMLLLLIWPLAKWLSWLQGRFSAPAQILLHTLATLPFSVIHVSGMVALRKLWYGLLGHSYHFGPVGYEFLYEYRKDAMTYLILVAVISSYRFIVRRLQRSEEHTSELQSRENLVCRLLLEKKKKKT